MLCNPLSFWQRLLLLVDYYYVLRTVEDSGIHYHPGSTGSEA